MNKIIKYVILKLKLIFCSTHERLMQNDFNFNIISKKLSYLIYNLKILKIYNE